MDLRQRLISNTVFSVIGLGVSRIIGFILTPYILFKLGQDNFGIWTIAGGLLGFVTKADLGVATSYTKFISQFYAKEDYDTINKVINSGFVFYLGISLGLYSLVYLGGPSFFGWYLHGKEAHVVHEITSLFYYLLLLSMVSWSLNIFSAVLWGIQRSDIIQKIRMVMFVANAVCIFFFLELGLQLKGLLWAEVVTTVLYSSAYIIFAYKFVPQLTFNPFLFDLGVFRKMFGYGIHLQFSRMAKVAQMHFSKVCLPYFLPLSSVTLYELGNRISLSVRSVPLSLSPAIIPAASQLHALEDADALRRLYDRASKYMTLSVMYLPGFAFCMMPVILRSWLGEQVDVQSIGTIARILLVGYAFYLLSDIASVVVLGMGHPEYLARASVVKLLVLSVLNLTLIPRFGVPAAAFATSLSEILGTLYFVLACHKELHRSYLNVVTDIYLRPFVAFCFASGITLASYKAMCVLCFIPQGRLQNIAAILGSGIIFSAGYGVFLFKSRYIDTYDKELISQYFRKGLSAVGFSRES
ncbi:MAG: oligosaccharide flippase family protein [bacterium]|nr:oligosaccharide flippase family protein [bacterium]